MINALTIDVEDYFHVSAFAKQIERSSWGEYESRIEANTQRLLDILDQHNHKATFFVLGWVAERYSRLIRDIAARGHEIGCHGYSHELVYDQTADRFHAETRRAKDALEDIAQQAIHGYRAASFSITAQSTWALDVLVDLGFTYDSSIFPTSHDRYGLPGAAAYPHRLTTPGGQELIEFPLSTIKLLGYRLPVAGGGYFRLYPYAFTRGALRRINHKDRQPFVFYLHPWEIDPAQPRLNGTVLSQFRHYNNLERCEARLQRLLSDFRFAAARDVLADLRLLSSEFQARVPH
jgi:polysaccharide deacetylase family protein (PEP-CTERM system associated)